VVVYYYIVSIVRVLEQIKTGWFVILCDILKSTIHYYYFGIYRGFLRSDWGGMKRDGLYFRPDPIAKVSTPYLVV